MTEWAVTVKATAMLILTDATDQLDIITLIVVLRAISVQSV